MSFFANWKLRRAKRALEARARSAEWAVAEKAIAQIPDILSAEEAFRILLPLARGHSNNDVAISGWSKSDQRLTITEEALTGRHIRSSIAALGRIGTPDATQHLLEILDSMQGYANEALLALGSPTHSRCAHELEERALRWPREKQRDATSALWRMETEEAFEAYLRLERTRYGGTRPFSDDSSRKAWLTAIAERRDPSLRPKPPPTKPLPLP